MSYLALDLLQTLEQSRASARYMFSGKDGHAELWIENGEISRIEGCTVDSLRKLLLQSPVEIWVRPLEVDNELNQNNSNIPIKNLAFEAAVHHDSGKNEIPNSSNVSTDDLQGLPNVQATPPLPSNTNASQTVTASYPLQKIAEAIEVTKIIPSGNDAVEKTQSYHTIQFTKNEPSQKIIGRTNQCDVIFMDKQVSRRHCEVKYDGSRILITDLDSSNGTFVNHVHITEPVEADPHDVIQVGSSTCILTVT